MGSNHEPEMKAICSYCKLRLTTTHTFSYGIPGMKQLLGCDRWWCKWHRKMVRKYETTLTAKIARAMRQAIREHREFHG